jgi:hypothetical protein
MPCYDPRDGWDRDLNHMGAGLLCELIKAGKVDPNDSPKLAEWWKDHQNRDDYYMRKSKP